MKMDNIKSRYVKAGVLAAHLGVERHLVTKWAAKGIIPVFRLPGGHLALYDILEVEAALQSYHRPAKPQQEGGAS